MEPSQIFEVSEECHSSESGWTMYIGSPVDGSSDGDADGPTDDDDGENDDYATDANNEDDSDDSMASDASSGPSHQGHPFGNGRRKNHHGLALYKQQNDVKFCLESKAKKPIMEKQRGERKEGKEELVLMGQKAKGSVQSCSKVRKSIWMGKRN